MMRDDCSASKMPLLLVRTGAGGENVSQ